MFFPVLTKAQDYYIYNVFETYFPYNPLASKFDVFFKKLNSDFALTNKSVRKRTDTSLFSFKGNYSDYQKKDLRHVNSAITLEEAILDVQDTLKRKDTFFQYKITFHYPRSPANASYVKKKFDQFNGDYQGVFTSKEDYDLKDREVKNGTERNYFMYFSPVSPLSVRWATFNNDESVFSISVYMKLVQNKLIMYTPGKRRLLRDKPVKPVIIDDFSGTEE